MQEPSQKKEKVTISYIMEKKRSQEKIIMLTAYDYPMARILEQTGCDIILVGDSLGMVVLGYPDTLSVTMEEMLHHTKAVSRACERAMVVADMPYLSYHLSKDEALLNAGRFIKEARAQAVKIEGGRKREQIVRHLIDAEIPVMGHIGLTPQSLHNMGGFRVQGKSMQRAMELMEDALSLQEAGAFALVLEGIPSELAKLITAKISIPTIGIGAGPHCDGQVLVTYDLIGLYDGFRPKFVRCYMELKEELKETFQHFYKDVKQGRFPSEKESYHLPEDVAQAIKEKLGKN